MTHSYILQSMDEAAFLKNLLNECSITFFTCHLVAKQCNWHKCYLKQQGVCSILITTIYINVYIWSISLIIWMIVRQKLCCVVEKTVCEAVSYSNTVWLMSAFFASGSTNADFECSGMIFFKGLIDTGESLSFINGIAWVFESRLWSFND